MHWYGLVRKTSLVEILTDWSNCSQSEILNNSSDILLPTFNSFIKLLDKNTLSFKTFNQLYCNTKTIIPCSKKFQQGIQIRRNILTRQETDDRIENVIKDWLKYASDRDGGWKKRKHAECNLSVLKSISLTCVKLN
jgi:hypothetical protein